MLAHWRMHVLRRLLLYVTFQPTYQLYYISPVVMAARWLYRSLYRADAFIDAMILSRQIHRQI